ncbi:hypothetical protein DAEQUDRAFT_720276 [Daedalea quercina L-15889]|uniref:Uncharacterized protein n=1 Tax=Daedalea quercina L-15889 TaxID=1314783 RepID=A0A165UKQ9_9APHY|nr:hypothetical protein DAEQUDRAFT_720276 [Daedalea quercina L-15889]
MHLSDFLSALSALCPRPVRLGKPFRARNFKVSCGFAEQISLLTYATRSLHPLTADLLSCLGPRAQPRGSLKVAVSIASEKCIVLDYAMSDAAPACLYMWRRCRPHHIDFAIICPPRRSCPSVRGKRLEYEPRAVEFDRGHAASCNEDTQTSIH